jgi:hypothetical protein
MRDNIENNTMLARLSCSLVEVIDFRLVRIVEASRYLKLLDSVVAIIFLNEMDGWHACSRRRSA